MSQIETIKNYLNEGNTINAFESVEKFDIYRLSAVIYYLRKHHNMDIVSMRGRYKNHVCTYYYLANNNKYVLEKIKRFIKNIFNK